MKIAPRLLLAAPLLLLAAEPAAAAMDPRFAEHDRSTAGFAGIHLRMNIGENRPAAPTARFAMGFLQYSDAVGAPAGRLHSSWLELGFSKRSRPELYVSGHRLRDVQKRLGIAPAAAVALGLGAVAAGAVVVASMDDEDLHRYQCLLPEKELCKE